MTRTILAALVLVMIASASATGDLSRRAPHPSLSPREVVRIIMTALRQIDAGGTDRGISVTLRFTSPANKQFTGPLSRFKAMIKGPAYGVIIGLRSVMFENYEVSGEQARIDAVLFAANGRNFGFRFGLSRKRGNHFNGSWMTDSVVPINIVRL